MLYYIINSFINSKVNTYDSIYYYINCHTDNTNHNLDRELKELTKSTIINNNNGKYSLTKVGFEIMNNHIKYHITKIINFYRKYKKNSSKFVLVKYREEQHKMRQYLINNKDHICILCNKRLPLCLLDTAHIKPYCLLNKNEKQDTNNIEFMCKYCHILFDRGHIGIFNGDIKTSNIYGYDINVSHKINIYNNMNSKYFNYHYKFIYNHKNWTSNIL